MDTILYDFASFEISPPLSCFDKSAGKYVDPDVSKILKSLGGPQLRITMDATRSGVLTNVRVYPGQHMRRATRTWTQHYGRPVLPQHPRRGVFSVSDEDRPVGRVSAARYTQLVTGTSFTEDYKAPQAYGDPGSGLITLVATVSGVDNVQAVFDHRWTTTSVGFSPLAVLCSICGHDWKGTNSPCEHEPGKTYEVKDKKGKKAARLTAYFIMPPKEYDHIAFVNTPAQGTSGVTEMKVLQDALRTDIPPQVRSAAALSEFAILDSSGNEFLFFEDEDHGTEPATRSFVSLPEDLRVTVQDHGDSSPQETVEDEMSENTKTLLERIQDRIQLYVSMSKEDPENYNNRRGANISKQLPDKPTPEDITALAQQILGFVSKDSEGDEVVLVDGVTEEITDEELDELHEEFAWMYQIDKTDPKKKPGGSNVGKYSKSEGPFCGPSGGAPTGSFPIGSLKRAKAALSYAHNAPKPDGIRACVCRKWGSQIDSCKKKKKKDEAQWEEFGIELDFTLVVEPNEAGFFVDTFGAFEQHNQKELEELKGSLPHQDALITEDERKAVDSRDFAGPNRTFLAGSVEQIKNSQKQLEETKLEISDEAKEQIKSALERRLELYGERPEETDSDSSDEEPQEETDTAQTIHDTLAARIQSLESKLDNLRDTLGEKEDELARARKKSVSDQKANRELLVGRLIDLRLALHKPETANCKTEEDLTALHEKFSARSVDSLLDAITDSRTELMSAKEVSQAIDPDLVRDGEVENDAPKQGHKESDTEKNAESSKDRAKRIFQR